MRPCKFCGRLQTHLSRHLLTSHRHERDISDITDLPHKEKVLVFAKMKKEGILQENRTRLKRPGDPLPLLHEKRQKNSSAVLKMCAKCRGFYASHLLWKHLLKCTGDEADCDTTGSDLRAASYVATINPEFNKILSCFHDDNIGTICKTDPMITVVGKALWERSVRKDKKTVMGEMRKLGNLLHVARTMTKTMI